MPESIAPVGFSKEEFSEATVLLNITLRASTDDPTFAGRFPATTGEFRARMLNDIYYFMFGHDHQEIQKRFGKIHERTGRLSNRLPLSRDHRDILLSEVETELHSRKHPTTTYRSILESIAGKLKIQQ